VSRIFLLLLFVAAVYILTLYHSQNFSSAVFQGETIKIDRNNYGIATIHASSIDQYLYALGTVLAEDRLFQITLRAYSAQGRLAESLGERLLDFDRFMREVNLKGWGDKRAARFAAENPAVYSTLSSMVLGINERVAQMSFLPLEFYLTGMRWENFTVNHLFYIDIQMEWSISMSITDEYTRSLLLNNYTQA
jgi:penicillin amidase